MFKVFDNYVNRINELIQSGSALCYGLRKFEVFLFDRESYDNVYESDFLSKICQDSRKLVIKELFDAG